MMNKYLAAAQGGRSMKSQGPAAEKEGQAQAKLHANTRQPIHPGSAAGLQSANGAVVEMKGNGYGGFRRSQSAQPVSMALTHPSLSKRASSHTNNTTFKRPQFEADKALRKLI